VLLLLRPDRASSRARSGLWVDAALAVADGAGMISAGASLA